MFDNKPVFLTEEAPKKLLKTRGEHIRTDFSLHTKRDRKIPRDSPVS
jgi:hypothetical protein